ncbi:MAG: small subunit ribosomal protein [Solirubrobacterales bacterium]|jgi:small subunit ribosomal protein S9|nr:small subunit ribosomal protein [Solirubrobacterales bacterium]
MFPEDEQTPDESTEETPAEETPEPEASESADPAPVAEEQGENAAPVDDAAAEQLEEPAGEPVAEAEESPAEAEPEAAEESPAEAEAEPEAAEEPAAEAEEPKPAAAEAPAEKPAAEEKKKDVIPGADLEPILVEPEGPALSAEEKARLEAEEEEKARREAELAAADEAAETATRAPAKMESGARFLATGKRKRSIARVTLLPGDGKIEINKRSLEEFFPRPLHQTMAVQPLTVSGYEGNVDVRIRVHGGGISGQAGAVRHGIARALTEIDPELRGDLKRRGFLTRDARVKERRKAGFKKARKKPQFSKR